jgi:hypothetical protein
LSAELAEAEELTFMTLLPRTLFVLLYSAASLLASLDPSFGDVSTQELTRLVMMPTLTKSSRLVAFDAVRVIADVRVLIDVGFKYHNCSTHYRC